MARQARRLAGIGAEDLATPAAFDAYKGPSREITVDPSRKSIRLHDGVTPGGVPFTPSVFMDARFFGAKFDGATDDTLAIQTAMNTAAAAGIPLHLPAGVSMVGKLTLPARLNMFGCGPVQTTLKCLRMAGANGIWINSSEEASHLVLREFGLDGGRLAGDALGADALRIFSSRPTVDNITIINARGWGLETDHVLNDGTYSILGSFRRITIDRTGGGGWKHRGPNDSYGASCEIVDVSQAQDLGYPGFLTLEVANQDQGTISFDNLHIWNRTTGVPRPNPGSILRPSSALQVDAGGQKFVNCMFESGGNAVVVLNGGLNMFENCAAFAPDGRVAALVINSPHNRFIGMVGGNKDFFAPDYLGVAFGSASALGNHIDVFDAGCTLGAVDFTNSGGNNRVTVRGWKLAGEESWIGVPKASDVVDISTDGPGGKSLIHEREIPWNSVAVAAIPGSGAFSDATATVRYLLRGKTVTFDATVSIATNGTAAGTVQVPLPLAPKRTGAAAGVNGNLTVLAALVNATTGRVVLTTAAGGYPGANGAVLFASGTYEIN